MGLLLEDEADCLNHQHKHRRHRRPIRRQSWAAAPYRASGLVLSAKADVRPRILLWLLTASDQPFAGGSGDRRLPLSACLPQVRAFDDRRPPTQQN